MNAKQLNSTVPSRLPVVALVLIVAASSLVAVPAQTPPGWDAEVEKETARISGTATMSGAESEVFAGSMMMAPGTRTPRWNLPATFANADVVIEGTLSGSSAEITLRAWSGTQSRDQSIMLNATGPFQIRHRFTGAFEGLELLHEGGANVTVERLSILPAGASTEAPRLAPVPDDRPPYYDDAPPADDPYFDEPPREPVRYGPPESVTIFRGDRRIREGDTTDAFRIDPNRRVLRVETVWTGWFFRGRIALLVDGERSSRWSTRQVAMRELESWPVNDYIRDLRFRVTGSSVNLQRVTVVYEGAPIYEEPYREPVVTINMPRPSDLMPPVLPDPRDFFSPPSPPRPNVPSRDVVTFGPTRIKENRSVTLRLPDRRHVEYVEINWSDNRDKAVGYVSIDDESWNARRGQDVDSPGIVDFRIDKRAHKVEIHAKKDDISIRWVKVYLR